MRLLINTLTLIMLTGLLAGGMIYKRHEDQESNRLAQAREDVRRMQRQISLQSALKEVVLTESGYPATVDPTWFEGELPLNNLLDDSHPWVEVASGADQMLMHPPDRVAVRRDQARFWYNPSNGVIRGRVPVATSDATALMNYNYINDSQLDSLFEDADAPLPDVESLPLRARRRS